MAENSKNVPIYKKWWFWVVLMCAFLFIYAISPKQDTEETISEPETNESIELSTELQSSDDEQDSNNTSNDPQMKIRGAVMIDTFAKWNEVDEVSLQVNENLGKAYEGDYLVIISANYNGSDSKLTDTLTSYCNKVATVLEQQEVSVSEVMISWTVPAKSKNAIGKCHYHNNGGAMVYDNESTGILQQK